MYSGLKQARSEGGSLRDEIPQAGPGGSPVQSPKGGFVMRCGCPECGTYMIQAEGINFGCVCPECLFRCRMCMGTNTVVSRENLKHLTFVDHTAEHDAQEEAGAPSREPLRPEDFID